MLALVASACGGVSADPEVTAGLADRSDAVAELIAAGDGCGAQAAGDELIAVAQQAADEQTIDRDLAARITDTTGRATAQLTCEPPAAQNADDGDDGDDGDEDDDEKGKGKGKGKDKGRDGGKD